jgi:hypothetical protein
LNYYSWLPLMLTRSKIAAVALWVLTTITWVLHHYHLIRFS